MSQTTSRQKAAPAVYDCNAVNRGVYIADNLDFLRSLNDACIDLVCIDPPFDKNETFVADKLKPPLTEAERQNELRLLAQWGVAGPEAAADAGLQWPVDHKVRGGYKDIWRWDTDIHEEWVRTLEAHYPAVHGLIETTRLTHSDGRAAYLCFMAIRLLEIHRALKPTGSLYLHCDHAANGYIRQLLDAVFGAQNFRNEIAWRKYTGRKNNAKSKFSTQQDTIFFYSKSRHTTFNVPYEPISEREIQKEYRFTDEDGRRYRESRGRRYQLTGENRRIYLDEQPGAAIGSLWVGNDIQLNTSASERTGYPTQKPVSLAERIIEASTNKGDIVLDCFAGCAYVATAAERLGRRWVACDMNPRAWTVFKRQFNKPNLALLTCNDEPAPGQGVLDGPHAQVFGPHELPTPEHITRPTELAPLATPERKFRQPKAKPVMTDDEMLTELLEFSGYTAWCCGFANRKPDGTVIRQTWNFHLDHVDPVSAGGINEIANRAPMCPHHNIRKSNRLVALREYRNQILAAGEMQMPPDQLVDLGQAMRHAMLTYARYDRERLPQTPMSRL